jgi:hypothetical protein
VRAGEPARSAPPSLVPLCGPHSPLANPYLQVARLAGTGRAALPAWGRLLGITVLQGTLTVGGVRVEGGRSALVPACLGGLEAELEGAHAVLNAAGFEP